MAHHNELGRWGEDIAAAALEAEGAVIRERNWRMGRLEIDIVACKGADLIFAEVKARADAGEDPLEAVDERKIAHMVRAAEAYLRGCDVPFGVRFDLFAIRGTPSSHTVEHIPDAFYPPLKSYR